MSVELEAFVGFNEQELWIIQESVPESNVRLLEKISEALKALRSDPPMYGGSVRLKPKDSV